MDFAGNAEKEKQRLTFRYNPTLEHELVTDQSFRTAGLMGLIYSTQDYTYDSLNDLLKVCKQLDQKFYPNQSHYLRVHGIYYKPGDKYVNLSCRIKNCNFRINHTYEKDEKGRPKSIKYH